MRSSCIDSLPDANGSRFWNLYGHDISARGVLRFGGHTDDTPKTPIDTPVTPVTPDSLRGKNAFSEFLAQRHKNAGRGGGGGGNAAQSRVVVGKIKIPISNLVKKGVSGVTDVSSRG